MNEDVLNYHVDSLMTLGGGRTSWVYFMAL